MNNQYIDMDFNNPKKFLKTQKNKLLLTDEQIEIMDRYKINWQSCSSYKEIVFNIEEYLSEDESEELERISEALQELSYYYETKK